MKPVIVVSILFFSIALPAVGELTDADLDKIRLIVKEEVKAEIAGVRQEIAGVKQELKAEIAASEKRTKEYIDVKIDSVDTNLNRVWLMIIALIGLITATIAIPQIIVAYRDRGRRELQTEIDQLRERLEALENTPS